MTITSLTQILLDMSFAVMLLAMATAFLRMLRGPSFTDRVTALDLIGMISGGMMIVFAVVNLQPVFLDAVIAFAMVSFLATIGIARHLERSKS